MLSPHLFYHKHSTINRTTKGKEEIVPKVNLSRYSQSKAPPIDWLWAAILERMKVRGYDLKRMAEIAGVSYEYMRRLINQPTNTWPYGALSNICTEFGIALVPTVDSSTPPKEMM